MFWANGIKMTAVAAYGTLIGVCFAVWGTPLSAEVGGASESANELIIISADYGVYGRYHDVTNLLRSSVRDGELNTTVGIETFGSDPAPGIRKHVVIHYRFNGWTDTARFFDGEPIRLRMPQHLEEIAVAGGLVILEAQFGAPGRYWDVTAIVQAMVDGNHLDAAPGVATYRMDPAPGVGKHTKIRYLLDGKEANVRVDEGKRIQLGTPADPGRGGNGSHRWIAVVLQCVLIGLAAALPLVLWRSGMWQRRVVVSTIAFVVCGSGVLLFQMPIVEPSLAHPHRPIEVRELGYVQSKSCKACHPAQYASWHKSFHRTMTQIARPEILLDTSESIEINGHYGDLYRIEREDEALWGVHIPDARYPEKQERRRIALTTGSHHMQIPWLETGESRRLVMFPFAFLKQEQQWVPRHALFINGTLEPPPEGTFGDESGGWNEICINCHATQGRRRTDTLERMDTRVAEMGIACEACHGPGEEHVAQNRSPARRYKLHFGESPDPTITNPARLAHHRGSEVCGQCHGITTARFPYEMPLVNWHGYEYRPGDHLEDERHLGSFGKDESGREDDSGYFWSDRMVRVSGREFTAFEQGNPCFKAGALSCMSCHQLHAPTDGTRDLEEWRDDQLKPGMRGNRACTQCHEQYAENLMRHTHHAPDSSGSNCMNCHMPHTVYGVLKAIRSHHIDEPSVQATVETGRPNACNLCHLDQTLNWTARHLEQWYEIPRPTLSRRQQEVASAAIWLLTGDAGQRALVAWSAGWAPARSISGTDWLVPFLAALLEDPYDAVRLVAWRSLKDLPAADGMDYDYVGSAAQRQEMRQRVLERWGRQTRQPVPHGANLLQRPDGTLDDDRFDTMFQDRNDRLIYLLE